MPINLLAGKLETVSQEKATNLLPELTGLYKDSEGEAKLPKVSPKKPLIEDLYNAFFSGLNRTWADTARSPAATFDLLHMPSNFLLKAAGRPDLQVQSPEWLMDNPIAELYDYQTEAFRKEISPTKSFEEAFETKDFDGIGRHIAIMVAENAPQQIGIILSYMAGYPGAGLAGMGMLTATQSLKEGRKRRKDPAMNAYNALAKATIEVGFESLGTFRLLDKQSKALIKSFGTKNAKKIVGDVFKTIFASMLGEGNEEFWTSLAQDFSDFSTGINPLALKGSLVRAFEAGTVGAISGGILTGPGAIQLGRRSVALEKMQKDVNQVTEALAEDKKVISEIEAVRRKDLGLPEIEKVTPVQKKELEAAEIKQVKEIIDVQEPELITDIKKLTEKINTFTSEGKPVPESLVKRQQALVNTLKALAPIETTTGLRKGVTQRVIKELTGITKPVKKVVVGERVLLTERIKTLARGFREGRTLTRAEIEATQTEVVDVLQKSKLEPKDKAKFISTIKNIQTREQLQQVLPEIQERIAVLEEKAEVRTLKKEIAKELKTVKPKTRAGKKTGKFTADVQEALDLIRSISKMTPLEAEKAIAQNLKTTQGLLPSEDIRLQNELLSLVAESEKQGVVSLNRLLNRIRVLKKQGKEARSLLREERKERLEKEKQTVIDQVTGGRGIQVGRETIGARKTRVKILKNALRGLGTRWILSWNGIMETLEFNAGVTSKKLKDLFGVLDQENSVRRLELDFRQRFDKAISESYNIENKNIAIHKKLNDLSQDVNLGTFKNSKGITVELIFTKDEIIKKWMELQDPTLIMSFEEGNNFTPEIVNAINEEMGSKDRTFAKRQFQMYREQWLKINPIYREFFGVNLSFSEFYSPIAKEGFQLDPLQSLSQLLEDNARRAGIRVTSLIARARNVLPLKTQSSVNVLDKHFKETNYFISWAEKLKDLNEVFKDSNVVEAINQEFSPGVLKAIGNTLSDLSSRGSKNARRFPVVDFFRKNFTIGKLMIKPVITVKQYVSTFAYLEKLNPIEFVAGIADFWLTGPVKNFKTLEAESIFIKTRSLKNMERDITEAVNSPIFKQYSKTRSFLNTLMLNVRLGDKGAIVFGSWALRRTRLKQKVDLPDIIREYEGFSADTQQSADLSRLSEVQRGGSIEKLFTMFKSAQRQYLAKELNAVKSLFQKGGFSPSNIGRVAKVMAIYHVLLPVMFQFIANAGGWSEEDKKEYIRAGIIGSLNGLFIFGEAVDAVIRKALGLRVWDLEIPLLAVKDSILKAMGKIEWDDITTEDVFEAMVALTGAVDSLAIPATTAKNMIIGVDDLINGNIKEGLLELMGYSSFITKDKKKGAPGSNRQVEF